MGPGDGRSLLRRRFLRVPVWGWIAVVALLAIAVVTSPGEESAEVADEGGSDAVADSQPEPTTSTTGATTSTTEASTSTTEASTSTETELAETSTTEAELEMVEFECGGEVIELPLGPDDDPEQLCATLQDTVFVANLDDLLPDLAEQVREAGAWDSIQLRGRRLCTVMSAAESQEELGVFILLAWGENSPEDQSRIFDNDFDTFAKFAAVSGGAYCPEAIERLQ